MPPASKTTPAPTADENATHYQKSSAAYYTLAALTLVYSFNFIDRQLLSILQEPIKNDLSLSDSQLGLLTGFSFALFYVVAGIPLGRMADKGNRRNLISWALATWSGMTALCGLAQNFWQLLLARIGVGVGEAGCSPPAHSMISDIFPLERRATALSIYSTGINIGILFGFLLGGWLNEFFGWRVAFMVVGLPGILLAVIVRFTVAEPIRGFSEPVRKLVTDEAIAFPLSQVVSLLWSRRSFRHLAMGASLTAFCGYGITSWIAPFILRMHDMNTGELGSWLAMTSVFGALGTLGSGLLVDRLGRSDKRWYMWVPAISTLILGPSFALCIVVDNVYQTLLINIIPTLVSTVYVGSCIAMVHALVNIRMRAVSSAIFFLILNIIGLGLGPLSIGVLSDFLEPSLGVESLRYAMLIIIPMVTAWAALHFFRAAKYLQKDLAV